MANVRCGHSPQAPADEAVCPLVLFPRCDHVPMRLVIAEDSLLVRQGLTALLAGLGHQVCGVAVRAEQVAPLVARSRPDIVVLDVRLPPTFTDEGIRLAARIRERYPRIGALVLAQHVEPAYADLLAR